MYTWSSVRHATRLKTTALCCMCAQTIIMCGGKAGCTEYIRNSTAEKKFHVTIRFRPEGEVRLGSCLCIKCNIMIDLKDCENILCGS